MPMETRSNTTTTTTSQNTLTSSKRLSLMENTNNNNNKAEGATVVRKRQKSTGALKKDGTRPRSRSRSTSKSPGRAAVSQLNRKHKVYTKKELNAISAKSAAESESLAEIVSKIDADSQIRSEDVPRRRSTRSASNKVAESVPVPVVKLTDALKAEKELSDSPAIIIDSSASRYQLRVRNSPFVADEQRLIRNSTPQMRLSASPLKSNDETSKKSDETKEIAKAVCASECWMSKYFYSGYLRYSYAEVALFVFVTLVALFGLVSLAGLVNVASPFELIKTQFDCVSNSVSQAFNIASEKFFKAVTSAKAFFNS